MGRNDEKVYCRALISAAKEKWSALPNGGHVKSAWPEEKFDKLSEEIEVETAQNLEWRYWPPLILFLERSPLPAILQFEADLSSVVNHSKEKRHKEVTHFLNAGSRDSRLWCAGLFEVFVKATLLRQMGAAAVEFDVALPNGRGPDVRVELQGKTMCLECTVITDSDEDQGTWEKFIAAKSIDPDAVLVRPGKFSPPDAKSPSSYYNCVRLFAKVYDKLAKDLDHSKSQFADGCPNLLLISFVYWAGNFSAMDPGAGWALDELFASQPRVGTVHGQIDISLLGWLDFMAQQLEAKSRLDRNSYARNLNALLHAPRRLGGVLLFDDCSFKAARRNYNAKAPCQLTHSDIARLEVLLGTFPPWHVPSRISV